MAKSKHRVGKTSKRKRQKLRADNNFGPFRMVIKEESLDDVTQNIDFLTIVKISRVLDSLSYCRQLMKKSSDGVVQPRHSIRSFFLLSGYLYEGFLVIDSLRSRYAKTPCFAPLLRMQDPTYSHLRKALKTIRNHVSFHLDADNKTTRHALQIISPRDHVFFTSPGSGVESDEFDFDSVSYDLALQLDLDYLASHPAFAEFDTYDDLFSEVISASGEFAMGGYGFISGLTQRIQLLRHLDLQKLGNTEAATGK